MEFDSELELEDMLSSLLSVAITNIAFEIRNVIRKSININTYGNLPNRAYASYVERNIDKDYPASWLSDLPSSGGLPTFEFRDEAWVMQKSQIIANKIIASVYYDGSKMSPPSASSPYRHGNFNLGIDRRQELAKLLNVLGYADNADFRKAGKTNSDGSPVNEVAVEKPRKPFFDEAIKWISANWEALAAKHLKAAGIPIDTQGVKKLTEFAPSASDIDSISEQYHFVDVAQKLDYGDSDPIFD